MTNFQKDGDLVRIISLSDSGAAQAIFGPLHRHLAHIQEAFRDPAAPCGAPASRRRRFQCSRHN